MQDHNKWSEQYHIFFHDIPIGLYVSTPSGQVEQVNAALVEMLGYPDAQTLLATNARALYANPEDRAQWQTILRCEGVVRDYEMPLRRYDGRIIWVRHSARAVKDAAGQTIGYAGAVQDITEQYADLLARARAEEQARVTAAENERLIGTLEERVRERTHELATLLEISQQVASTLDLDALLDLILTQLQSVVPYDGASILTLDGDVLRIRAYRGPISQAQALAHHFHLEQAHPDREVVRHRRPVIIPDVRGETPMARAFQQTTGGQLETTYGYIRSWMGVPLIVKGQVIGMLSLDHSQPDFYTPRHADLAWAFADQAAVALENARLYREESIRLQEAQRRREVAEGLSDILASLNTARPLAEVLDYIATLAHRLLRADAVAIYRLEPGADVLRIQAAQGLDPEYVENMFVGVGYGAVGQAVVKREPVAIPELLGAEPDELNPPLDGTRLALLKRLAERYRALLGVPLIIQGEVYGGIALYYEAPRKFTTDEIQLASMFGAQTALAIENARLRAQAEQAAATAERTRLARDLHDSVTQLLYSLALQAEAGRGKAERGEVRRVQEHLIEIAETAQQALKEMRLLVHELRPLVLDRDGLIGALNQRLDAVERRAGIEAYLVTENWTGVPAPIEEELYHVARETLNNSLKHAAATSVTVQLRRAGGHAEMKISNNGRSFDPVLAREGGGLGLTSMLERTDKLGGQLTISSTPGLGTIVTVEVPVP
jgi:PAS domain S-box-containing protein